MYLKYVNLYGSNLMLLYVGNCGYSCVCIASCCMVKLVEIVLQLELSPGNKDQSEEDSDNEEGNTEQISFEVSVYLFIICNMYK